MAQAAADRKSTLTIIAAGLVGNMVEWFDFAVYGNFAIIIGILFFPASDPRVSLIASFGAFAAGFLARPLGGFIFGRLGDVMGRQEAMTISILAMSLPTVVIAVLPGFEQWGIWAPMALIGLRIVQGLSVGGEYTSSLVFLAERSGKGRQAQMSVWGAWGAVLGMLLGSVVAVALAALVGEEAMRAWGWRVLFATGGLVALSGLWIRRMLPPEAPRPKTKAPVAELLAHHKGDLFFLFLINIGGAATFYTVMVYTVTFMRTVNDFDRIAALKLGIFSMGFMLLCLPIAAWISDRLGLRKVLTWCTGIAAASSIVLFRGLLSDEILLVYLAQAGFSGLVALLLASLITLSVGILPPQVRCTGLAVAYNLSVGIFGGLTPMVATWLISWTGNPMAPAFWLSASLFVSLLALLFYRTPRHRHQQV